MNGAHAHLLVNHIPLFCVSFGFAALLWSSVRKSAEMRWAAIGLFLVAGIAGWIAMETGESAEDLAKNLPGVTKAFIHEHEEAAEAANIATTIVAVGAIGMALIGRVKPQFLKLTQTLVLVLSLVATLLMGRAANLGGEVRHTEIRSDASLSLPASDDAED